MDLNKEEREAGEKSLLWMVRPGWEDSVEWAWVI